MGFSFRNLFSDNSEEVGHPQPPAAESGMAGRPGEPAMPGSVAGSEEPIFSDPQPTDRGSFEQMFAGGRPGEAQPTAGAPFGAAPVNEPGPTAQFSAGELLRYIPPALASPESVAADQPVMVMLPPDGSRDVKLSTIYQACPQLFATEITPLNDSQLTLPGEFGAAPVAAVDPFANPAAAAVDAGVSGLPTPEVQPQVPQRFAEAEAGTGSASAALPNQFAAPASVNPFDPAAAAEPSATPAGMAPQAASPAPMSWQNSASDGSSQAPQADQAQAGPSAVGANPFQPNPLTGGAPLSPPETGAPSSPSPDPQQAAAPFASAESVFGSQFSVPASGEPLNGDDTSDSGGGDGGNWPGFSAGGELQDPSPFDLDDDNPFFLAEDDEDSDEPVGSEGEPGPTAAPEAFQTAPSPEVVPVSPAPATSSSAPAPMFGFSPPAEAAPSAGDALEAAPAPQVESFFPAASPQPLVENEVGSEVEASAQPEVESQLPPIEVPSAQDAAANQGFLPPSATPAAGERASFDPFKPAAEAPSIPAPAASVFQPAEPAEAAMPPASDSLPLATETATAARTLEFSLSDLLSGISSEELGFSPDLLPAGLIARLPLSRIEPQLTAGRAKVSLGDLAAAVDPPHGMMLAQGNQAVEVELPENLVFHQLQGLDMVPPVATPPATAEPIVESLPAATLGAEAEPEPQGQTTAEASPSSFSESQAPPAAGFGADLFQAQSSSPAPESEPVFKSEFEAEVELADDLPAAAPSEAAALPMPKSQLPVNPDPDPIPVAPASTDADLHLPPKATALPEPREKPVPQAPAESESPPAAPFPASLHSSPGAGSSFATPFSAAAEEDETLSMFAPVPKNELDVEAPAGIGGQVGGGTEFRSEFKDSPVGEPVPAESEIDAEPEFATAASNNGEAAGEGDDDGIPSTLPPPLPMNTAMPAAAARASNWMKSIPGPLNQSKPTLRPERAAVAEADLASDSPAKMDSPADSAGDTPSEARKSGVLPKVEAPKSEASFGSGVDGGESNAPKVTVRSWGPSKAKPEGEAIATASKEDAEGKPGEEAEAAGGAIEEHDFAMDAENDGDVASFYTPSTPEADANPEPASKRAPQDMDSLDTLPVLEQGCGFFDELEPPAFSFENEPTELEAEALEEDEPADPADVLDDDESEPADPADVLEKDELVDQAEGLEEDEPVDQAEATEERGAEAPVIPVAEPFGEARSTSNAFGFSEAGGASAPETARDVELRAVFATAEEFTLQRVAELSLDLCSGIDSCSILTRGRTVCVSRRDGATRGVEAERQARKARAMYRNLKDLADNAGLAQAEALTVHTDDDALSFFARGDTCLTVRHERGGFRPGVREKLILVARGVAGLDK